MEKQYKMNKTRKELKEQRKLLLKFCDHLNTYQGLEGFRFDFMMQDFLDKKKNG